MTKGGEDNRRLLPSSRRRESLLEERNRLREHKNPTPAPCCSSQTVWMGKTPTMLTGVMAKREEEMGGDVLSKRYQEMATEEGGSSTARGRRPSGIVAEVAPRDQIKSYTRHIVVWGTTKSSLHGNRPQSLDHQLDPNGSQITRSSSSLPAARSPNTRSSSGFSGISGRSSVISPDRPMGINGPRDLEASAKELLFFQKRCVNMGFKNKTGN
ncbi:hypothetical protein KSP40_PGU018233 [Platanthera guangdongensis]|uniref:Uncharacterized protein n=1 Tax=Platanthera guangdongensis TaxID=2320717 RepID=A0ABR2MQE6_9ASPA